LVIRSPIWHTAASFMKGSLFCKSPATCWSLASLTLKPLRWRRHILPKLQFSRL
jgi:hypothetical protein